MIGLGLLFVKAPDPRFNWAYFVIIFCLFPWLWNINKFIVPRLKKLSFLSIAGILGCVLIFASLHQSPYEKQLSSLIVKEVIINQAHTTSFLWLPPPITPYLFQKQNNAKRTKQLTPFTLVKNTSSPFVYYHPLQGSLCWDSLLPCTPEPLSAKPFQLILQNEEKGIGAGFRKK